MSLSLWSEINGMQIGFAGFQGLQSGEKPSKKGI
jgi:hypothetical protein